MDMTDKDDQCVTTTRDITSPWWKVELQTAIQVIQVYMVTRMESRTTDLIHCDIHVVHIMARTQNITITVATTIRPAAPNPMHGFMSGAFLFP